MRAFASRAAAAPAAGTSLLVQRCSCGGSGHAAGEMCEECREKEATGLQAKLIVGAADDFWEREADAAARAVSADAAPSATAGPVARVSRRADASAGGTHEAPASVSRVVTAAGEPLGRAERAYFEPRFGHDFGQVRVHRDAAAAASAREIAAHAYTVGRHLVFGTGAYAPGSPAGRSLIAHELAHVVQQTGRIQRDSISTEPATVEGDEEEREEAAPEPQPEEETETAAGIAVQRLPLDGNPDEMSGPWPEKDEAERIAAETDAMYKCLDAEQCKPMRPLTWADFKGTMGAKNKFAAATASDLRIVPNAARKCFAGTAGAREGNPRGIEAFMKPASSKAKTVLKKAANMKANGCAGRVAKCKAHFKKMAKKGFTNVTFSMGTDPDPNCLAGITPRGDEATSKAECDTVVGKDCLDRQVAEAARVLKHEQGHFDLTCAMAKKANAMVTKDTDVDALLRAVRRVTAQQQRSYDAASESDHGCNADGQAKWEADIAAGLPAVNIDVTAADSRRRRGGRRRR